MIPAFQPVNCQGAEDKGMQEGTPPTNVGIITMAYGKQKYFDQAVTLARSLRLHMPDYKLAIITDRTDAGPLFDDVINISDFTVAGTLLKIRMYEESPYQENFFIDSDCIVAKNFENCLSDIRKYDFTPIVNQYLKDGDQDLWLDDVGQALRTLNADRFPKFNGGVYFFRKSEYASSIFKRANELLSLKNELGILDFDSAGPGEETLIGLAMAEMGITELYNDDGALMRTPLNSTGPITLDVFNSRSRFVKNGKEVSPAIVHFCGPWIDHPAYTIAADELKAGAPMSPGLKTWRNIRYKARSAINRFVR